MWSSLSLFLVFVQRRRRRLSFSFILPIDDFQSMLLVYWGLDLFHLFLSLSLLSLSVLSTRRSRRSRSDTEHWRCKGKLTSLLLFVRERASKSLRWCFDFTLEYLLVRLLLLLMLLLLQQQHQQVVNHQHMVFSVCCLFASLVSSFSFSFIERERWYNTMQTFLPSNSWLINSLLTHSLTLVLICCCMRGWERGWERGASLK